MNSFLGVVDLAETILLHALEQELLTIGARLGVQEFSFLVDSYNHKHASA
jgi:hypothetical protein